MHQYCDIYIYINIYYTTLQYTTLITLQSQRDVTHHQNNETKHHRAASTISTLHAIDTMTSLLLCYLLRHIKLKCDLMDKN